MTIPKAWIAGISGRGVILAALLACLQPAPAAGGAEPAAAPSTGRGNGFKFSLLPKSLQRRPALDFHVITELTDAGRKVAPPSAAAPAYYIAQPGQFTQMGTNTSAGERPPDLAQLTRAMEKALANGGYLKAAPGTPLPSIAVVFNYGSFARFSLQMYDMADDQLLAEAIPDSTPMVRTDERSTDALLKIVLQDKAAREDVLQRATLVGGEKFTRELARVFKEEAEIRLGNQALSELGFSEIDAAGPFHRFFDGNSNLMMLVEDSFNDCYFVIASAFDYVAMKKGQRVLLWRTKMTVSASGVSMTESLPALVVSAGPYLGKDMADAITVSRRISREGKVELGELKIIESDVPLPGATGDAHGSTPQTGKPAESDRSKP
ncbi:MAG TPA: hypothetical protein VG734_05775 [Lacunisphaera sp.]|nr:hypothetical protein [Lacunisphaera sp.]